MREGGKESRSAPAVPRRRSRSPRLERERDSGAWEARRFRKGVRRDGPWWRGAWFACGEGGGCFRRFSQMFSAPVGLARCTAGCSAARRDRRQFLYTTGGVKTGVLGHGV